jgi:hypothetical protein
MLRIVLAVLVRNFGVHRPGEVVLNKATRDFECKLGMSGATNLQSPAGASRRRRQQLLAAARRASLDWASSAGQSSACWRTSLQRKKNTWVNPRDGQKRTWRRLLVLRVRGVGK